MEITFTVNLHAFGMALLWISIGLVGLFVFLQVIFWWAGARGD